MFSFQGIVKMSSEQLILYWVKETFPSFQENTNTTHNKKGDIMTF